MQLKTIIDNQLIFFKNTILGIGVITIPFILFIDYIYSDIYIISIIGYICLQYFFLINTTKEYLSINNTNMNIISSIYILTILVILYNLK